MKKNSIKIEDATFVIFDTETTGDNSNGKDKPIEIAVVKWNINKGFLGAPTSWLINPEMLIHPSAIAVHGLMDSDLIGAPLLKDVLPILHEYIEDSVLVAHNIGFDLNMLPSLNDVSNYKMDSLRFARHIYRIGDLGLNGHDLRSHKCQELRYWMGLDVDTMGLQAHRAAADILVTGEVFDRLLREYIKRSNAKYLYELNDFINAPILIKKMNFGKFKNELIEDCVREESKSSKNYFSWLLKKINSGEMKIDNDLKYSIEYYLKRNNMDPNSLLIEEKIKSWKDVTKALSRTR